MPSLQSDIRKKHPFDLPEQEACLDVIRTASVLAAPFERLFRAHGLSSSGYNILRILRGAGGEPRCPAEIAGDLVAEVPDMTRLLDRLASAGLVSRAREDASDRRKVAVRLTDSGRTLLETLDRPLLDLHRAQLGAVPREDLHELSRLLVAARECAATFEDPTQPDKPSGDSRSAAVKGAPTARGAPGARTWASPAGARRRAGKQRPPRR